MQICLINGSSRTNGRTAGVLSRIQSEFRSRGASASLIHLRNAGLGPCDGLQTPRLRPDFKRLFTRLMEASGIIFATPTYWFNMSGLMKNLLDRLTVAEQGWPLEGKVAGFIATGAPDEDGAMLALTSMAAMTNHLGMVTFPYSMVYLRRAKPGWAHKAVGNYAENMMHMINVMTKDARQWK